MTKKYTAKIETLSYYDSRVVAEFTGTLEEIADWGYRGRPESPNPDPKYNRYCDNDHMTEAAIDYMTGKPVHGYQWWNDGQGDFPANIEPYADTHSVEVIDAETWNEYQDKEDPSEFIRKYLDWDYFFTLHPEPLPYTEEKVLEYLRYTCDDTQHNVMLEPVA